MHTHLTTPWLLFLVNSSHTKSWELLYSVSSWDLSPFKLVPQIYIILIILKNSLAILHCTLSSSENWVSFQQLPLSGLFVCNLVDGVTCKVPFQYIYTTSIMIADFIPIVTSQRKCCFSVYRTVSHWHTDLSEIHSPFASLSLLCDAYNCRRWKAGNYVLEGGWGESDCY